MSRDAKQMWVDNEWIERLDALVPVVQAQNPAFTVTRKSVHLLVLRRGYDALVEEGAALDAPK